ncbi:hypothetical protein [Haloarchaeobius iranensis]|uniref:DUF7979 domain-containing protein n=1 Tax=Haloarchaeobius iranensis TaxID=996166 RepID=A0A1G9YGW8_9EURY|nr:hypothetical protein [Haloarchaeobius iranensis]SDN08250.1 hypothetical protein SAMN05192554_11464 [Haloarchaeobius iranensis]
MVDIDAVLTVLAVVLLSAAALVGGLFVFATVDPGPSPADDPGVQHVLVNEVESPENRSVLQFETLSAEQQREFRRVLNASDRALALPKPVELESIDSHRFYIEYEGTLYDISFPTP